MSALPTINDISLISWKWKCKIWEYAKFQRKAWTLFYSPILPFLLVLEGRRLFRPGLVEIHEEVEQLWQLSKSTLSITAGADADLCSSSNTASSYHVIQQSCEVCLAFTWRHSLYVNNNAVTWSNRWRHQFRGRTAEQGLIAEMLYFCSDLATTSWRTPGTGTVCHDVCQSRVSQGWVTWCNWPLDHAIVIPLSFGSGAALWQTCLLEEPVASRDVMRPWWSSRICACLCLGNPPLAGNCWEDASKMIFCVW